MSTISKPRSGRACPERCRRDGWTLERQATFLATLERTGNVRTAAGAAGMNRASAYRFRDRPGGERFRYAWNLALARRRERLLQERLAMATHFLARLAVNGKGDTAQASVLPRESGKGDTHGGTAQRRQPSQACRFPILPGAARGTIHRRMNGGGGGVQGSEPPPSALRAATSPSRGGSPISET
jgi:hypothetical protein